MTSPFTAILSGQDSALTLAENEHFVAVLERAPLVLGHVVVISKNPTDDVFDLSDSALGTLMVFSRRISHAIRQAIPCEKVGVAVIGLVTRHAHLHLVPIQSADDLNFTRPKLSPPEAALLETADRIRATLMDAHL